MGNIHVKNHPKYDLKVVFVLDYMYLMQLGFRFTVNLTGSCTDNQNSWRKKSTYVMK